VALGKARKALIIFGGIGMTLLIPTIFTTNLYLIAFLFALAPSATRASRPWPTFSRRPLQQRIRGIRQRTQRHPVPASARSLPSNSSAIFPTPARPPARIPSIPLSSSAGLVPFLGMILVLLLVRNNHATDEGLVRRI